jgi:thioredoxin reductase (NADPH)
VSAFAAGGDAAEPRDGFDVAIVGAGPGGMTAAIYASRARLSTVVLERNTAGGIMSVTERVENYPGFPEGITGFELAEKMKQQACQFGADLREIDGVVSLEQRADGSWTVVTDEATVTARAVILSPGVEARKLGVPGEAEFMGRGVSYCATCDGPLYRGKEVVVIGGGNAAVEEGMFLARFASAVHVVHRRDALRATAIAQERAFAQPNMHFIWNGQVRRIVGETKVEGVDYEHVVDHTTHTLPVSGVFFYVGQLPQTAFLRGTVELDDDGFIVTDTHLRTSRPGVFACGDARAGIIKQIANAVGEGALAAIGAEKYLDELDFAARQAGAGAPAHPAADTAS